MTAVEGTTFTLNRPADTFTNAIVEWPDHQCAGWEIRNCRWQDNYQRLMIQSGPGTLRNCVIERTGNAVELNSVMPYVEGSVPRDIAITDNVFRQVAPGLGGTAIRSHARTFSPACAPTFTGIRIAGNTFDRPVAEAVRLPPGTDLSLDRNRTRERDPAPNSAQP